VTSSRRKTAATKHNSNNNDDDDDDANTHLVVSHIKVKGKGFPYSIPSVGPGTDPGVQAVSPQATVSHPPGGRLPLLSARPAVTFPAAEHHPTPLWPVQSYTAW